MIEKYNHKYSIAAVEQDDYLREVIEKKLPQVCKAANFPDMQFDARTYRELEDFEIDVKEEIDMLLLDYPLDPLDVNSEKLINTLNDLNRVKKIRSVVILSDCDDIELMNKLKESGIKEIIQKDNNFANRIWAIIYGDIKTISKVDDYNTNGNS